MSQLHPALDAALAEDRVTIFGALMLEVGSDTMRVLDGSFELEIDSELYSGEDETYGSWEALEAFEDGTGDEAPGLTIGILPKDDDAMVALTDPEMQGKAVMIMLAAKDDATGLLIGEPYVLLDGEVDVPTHRAGPHTLVAELDCVGGQEELFFEDEGIVLAPSFHKQVWPTETGLNAVTGITDTIYWGGIAPTSPVR